MESNIKIKVEYLAGTTVEDAAKEAKTKAIAWDVAFVYFKFNDVMFSIGQNADINDVVRQYRDNSKNIIA
jgi:hypothetical protein